MPIRRDRVGLRSGPNRRSWDHKDCLLYALGVGAGSEDSCAELEFTTENTIGVDQRVLPTMAVVLGARGASLSELIGPFAPGMLVHGEQAITLHREIPVEGELETVREITGIYDKGSGALVVTEDTSKLVGSEEPLFSTRSAVFVRGEGGWGGERGPSGKTNQPPSERGPDAVVTYQTGIDQALLYRLSGDRHPLHSDPSYAAKGGFDRPILHGLCTYGFTGRALLHARCESDPARFHSMSGRFSAPVFPGEALTVQIWDDVDSGTTFRTLGEDGRIVLDAGRFERR